MVARWRGAGMAPRHCFAPCGNDNDAETVMTPRLNNVAGMHVVVLRNHVLRLFPCIRRNWRARAGALVLAVVMLAGVMAPLVPARVERVVLMNSERRVVAQGSLEELAELAALQRSNAELRLVKCSAVPVRAEVAGMPAQGGASIEVCGEVPRTLTWGEPEGRGEEVEVVLRRVLCGYKLRMRHYG